MWVFRDFRSTCYLNTYWVEFSCHLIYSPLQVSLLLSFFPPLIVFTSLCFPPPCRPVLMCRLVCVCVWTAGSHSIKPHCLEMESLLFLKNSYRHVFWLQLLCVETYVQVILGFICEINNVQYCFVSHWHLKRFKLPGWHLFYCSNLTKWYCDVTCRSQMFLFCFFFSKNLWMMTKWWSDFILNSTCKVNFTEAL